MNDNSSHSSIEQSQKASAPHYAITGSPDFMDGYAAAILKASWREEEIPTLLHPLPVESMWGLKKRAETLRTEFKAQTVGDVARIPIGQLRARFGVWGVVT